MKSEVKHYLSMVIMLVVILPMLIVAAFAATTVTPISGCVTVTDSLGNGSLSSGTVTITASGYWSSKTNTVTIANSSSSKATIKFDYIASGSIDSFSESTTSGSVDTTLDAGGTYTMSISNTKKAFSSTTATLKLSNFSYTEVVDGATVNVSHNTLGSVTVAGTAVANGGSTTISSDGAAIVATPVAGATFVAWVDADTNTIISQSASYTLMPSASTMNLWAIFTTADQAAYYKVGSTLYTDLNAAISAASSGTDKVVVVISDGTLPTGTYHVSGGVTLLVPYISTDTTIDTSTTTVEGGWDSTLEYANTTLISAYTHKSANVSDNILRPNNGVNYTFTIPSGTTLNVASNGKFIIGGTIASGHSNTAGICGGTSGDHANVQLEGTVNVNDGAILSCCGYILGGGQLNVASGGTVYQPFVLMDHRDGHYAVISNNDQSFPFNRYAMMNIQSNIRMVSGAKMKGYVDLYTQTTSASIITVKERHNVTCLPVIDASGSLINLTDGTLDISYNASRYVNDSSHNSTGLYDRVGTTVLNFSGGASLGSMSLKINVAGSDYNLDTSTDYFPVPYNYIVNLNSGTFTIDNSMKLLPGSKMTVASGATLNVSSGLAVMDGFRDHAVRGSSADANTWPVYHYPSSSVLQASPISGNGVGNLIVNGTMNVSGTFGGIVQTNGAGTVSMNGTNTLELGVGSPSANKIMGFLDTAVCGKTVRTLEAELFKVNGGRITMESGKTYVGVDSRTNKIESYTYTLYNSSSDTSSTTSLTQTLNADLTGTWKCESCTYGDWVQTVAPTCTVPGSQTRTCSVCGNTETETVAATGHSWDLVNGVCGTCGEKCAAKIVGGTYQPTLKDAVEAAADGAHIQMCTDSGEDNCVISKIIYLDLAGFDVSGVTIGTNGTLCGADNKTNGYSAGEEGHLYLERTAQVADAANVDSRNYVAIYDENNKYYTFHRFEITPTRCMYYYNEGAHSHLAFEATVQGDSKAVAAFTDVAFAVGTDVNDLDEYWYRGTDSKKALPGHKGTISFVALDFDSNSNDWDTAYTVVAKAKFDNGGIISSEAGSAVSFNKAKAGAT